MSHATYAFLFNLYDPDPDDESLKGEAMNAMSSWAEDHCDENNWYQELSVVMQDGREVKLCDDGDYRGRDEFGEDIAAMPQEKRWEWARLFALKCVANEMELGDRSRWGFGQDREEEPYWQRFELLQEQILEEVPATLAKLWGLGAMLHDDSLSQEESMERFLVNYKRSRLSKTFIYFIDSLRDGHAPFSSGGTPYEYRAFNLAEHREGEAKLAILFVDIHT